MNDVVTLNRGTHFLGLDTPYEQATHVIFGAPFDGTTSYRPGTRFGPAAIRNESYALESYSPYQNADAYDYLIYDAGDLELPFGNSAKVLSTIEKQTSSFLKDGKFPILLGGEHLITLGAVRAASAAYPDLHLIQFDAHTDLRDDYIGEKLSHASVMRRCWEILGDGRIHQFGIRSGERDEFIWAKTHTDLHLHNLADLPAVVKGLGDVPIYLTIDLDVLDPACFPGTGTPEAGGITFTELMEGFAAMRDLNIVAADLNELAPNLDPSYMSVSLAGKILRELLIMLNR
ncbi:MAG TPA: agmatinase [Clostridiaceae bacterium]|nr:agmatinase [Clostridiaceae bacterium]